MNKVAEEFVSKDNKMYRFKIGHFHASSLAGFVAGNVFASIIWIVVYYLINGVR